MKKLIIAAAVLGVATLFTSCKKDYTCECRTTNTIVSVNKKYEIKDAKKKDAEAECNNYATTGTTLEFSCMLR